MSPKFTLSAPFFYASAAMATGIMFSGCPSVQLSHSCEHNISRMCEGVFFFSNVHLDTRMNWLGFAHFSTLLSRTVIRTTFYTNVEEDQVMKWRHVISKRSEVNFIIIFSKKKCSIQRQRSGAETRSVRGGTQPRGSKCSCAWNAYCWSAPKQKGKNPRMWNPAWK